MTTDYDLCRAIRMAYQHAMATHRSTEKAMDECLAILSRYRLQPVGSDARRLIAQMIAEEPPA
jgi:hypothetical protein